MQTKMKGLLRGLRYISQIFDEKEPEMQIGYPTDVKHVAHIGWDGPSASKPSWMDEFKSTPENANGNSNLVPSTDTIEGEKPKHRSRCPASGANSPMNSPGRRSGDGLKHSKRQPPAAISSPIHSPPKQSRRHRGINTSTDSPSRESARDTRRLQISVFGTESVPRHFRVRKSKESSRKKDKNPSTDTESSEFRPMQATKNYAGHLSSVLEVYEQEPRKRTDNWPEFEGRGSVEN